MPDDPHTITAIKTAVFQFREPTARKRAILLGALKRSHLATRALLAAFIAEIDRIAAVPSQTGRLSIMQRITSRVLATWDLCGSSTASARVDAMALIESYLASRGDGREKASLPTVPGLESTTPAYSSALLALAECVPDLDQEKSLRDEINRLAHEPRLRPLGLYGYRYFYRFLQHPATGRLYAWVNLMPRISRHAPSQTEANQIARDAAGDMIDIATGEVVRCKRPCWVLFPLSFSFSYQEQEFLLAAEPCGGRLVYRPEADRFELHAAFRFKAPAIDTEQRFCGVDRGLYNLVAWTVIDGSGAVLEDGAVSGLGLRHVQRAIERRKTTEQRRGRQPTGRQKHSHAEEAVHTAINAVIAAARRHRARVVLEDLTIQRRLSALPRGYRGGRGARNFRRIIGRQQYGRVEHALGYKLSLAGLPQAMKVRPHGTSITCPICGHADTANRPKVKIPGTDQIDTSQFACQRCGYVKDADINAGRVIALKGLWLSGLPTKAARGGRELSEAEKFPAWLSALIASRKEQE